MSYGLISNLKQLICAPNNIFNLMFRCAAPGRLTIKSIYYKYFAALPLYRIQKKFIAAEPQNICRLQMHISF